MNLFNDIDPSLNQSEVIAGLSYLPNYITPEEERELINTIDNQPWLTDLKRCTQHYGYKYDYTARKIDSSLKIGEIPNWLDKYCDHLSKKGMFKEKPDQVIINEYVLGQGISAHVDCIPCFAEEIASISLGSSCVMEFTNPLTKEKVSKLLEPRSLLIFKGDARYKWLHSIPPRKSDVWDGAKIARCRRISLTFRKVILKQ